MTGIQTMLIPTKTKTKIRPTIINSQSLAFGLARFQISIVNNVELELKIDVNDDMSAAIMTANIRPRAPTGNFLTTSFGYATFEQPFAILQTSLQTFGSSQPISSLK